MRQHTEGPWDSFDSNDIVQAEDPTKHIATVWNHNNISPDEAIANGRLAAAAPDYHAAVETMIANEQCGGDGWWEGWDALKVAHTKAQGE